MQMTFTGELKNEIYNRSYYMNHNDNVTYSMIRHLIWTGKLTKIKYGSAWLVNMDELYAFFWGELK